MTNDNNSFSIGQKLRIARIEAGMTQKQLAGDRITRNMLSQIENGSASPSVATLYYLAGRMNIPPSYFLSDSNDSFMSKKAGLISQIRKKLGAGDWNGCIELCSSFAGREDDELNLILARCFCESAISEYRQGKLRAARHTFETALRHAEATVYPCEQTVYTARHYCNLIDSVKIDGESEITVGDSFHPFRDTGCADAFMYIEAIRQIKVGEYGSVRLLLDEGFITEKRYITHLKAKLAVADGRIADALEMLKALSGEDISTIMRYEVLFDMEAIYTAHHDFENAYICSQAKLRLYSEIKF